MVSLRSGEIFLLQSGHGSGQMYIVGRNTNILQRRISMGMVGYLFLVGLAHLADAGGLYEVRQLERRLLQAPLPLQVLPL